MLSSVARLLAVFLFNLLSSGALAAQWEIPAQCQRPSEGRHLDVLNHPGARLLANYRLVVLPPLDGHQRFEAILNVQFIRMDYTLTPTGYRGWEPVSPEEERSYRNEVQACWDQASKFMIGPNGETLRIRLGANTKIWKAALQSGGHVEITCSCLPWLPGVVSERQCKKIVATMTSHGDRCPKGTGPSISILYPAQFRAIVWPNCERENRTYYSCVANDHRAYGTACLDLPAVCRSPSDWLK